MQRSIQHLTYSQRCQIFALHASKKKQCEIAAQLGFSESAISRELRRCGTKENYNPEEAHLKAIAARENSGIMNRKIVGELKIRIDECLRKKWSPEQTAGVLKIEGLKICHVAIYDYVWSDRKSGGTLYKDLRYGGKKRNKRGGINARRSIIKNRVDIKERPKIVEEKSRFGDFEGDTIVGHGHKGFLLSLVDRHTKLTMLVKLADKTAQGVFKAIVSRLYPIRDSVKTMTFDNGTEFAMHDSITTAIGALCYFATPYHSWERGLNEHTNGLVRQYMPKSTNFNDVTDEQIMYVEQELNNRPRKVLGYRTPQQVYLDLANHSKNLAFQS